jgi:hypothetical protein
MITLIVTETLFVTEDATVKDNCDSNVKLELNHIKVV